MKEITIILEVNEDEEVSDIEQLITEALGEQGVEYTYEIID